MKAWLGVIGAFALAACGPSEQELAEIANQTAQWDAELAAKKEKEAAAEVRAKAGISEIKYPECDKAFDNGVTTCGKKVFKTSMSECRSRAIKWEPSGTIVDEYVGDSWQEAAGSEASADDDERISRINEMSKEVENSIMRGYQAQYVAIILGNGTRNIRKYFCNLDESLKIKEFGQGLLVTVK